MVKNTYYLEWLHVQFPAHTWQPRLPVPSVSGDVSAELLYALGAHKLTQKQNTHHLKGETSYKSLEDLRSEDQ